MIRNACKPSKSSATLMPVIGLVLLCLSVPLRGQNPTQAQCPDGRWVPYGQPCSNPRSNSNRSSSSSSSTSSSTVDNSAERAREIEIKRQKELQRQREEELRREEEAKIKKQEEFIEERNKTLRSLKGISSNEVGLKGANTAFFGLKGMSPTEASTLIKTGRPDNGVRDVSTAWQQLHCAAELTDYAIQKARKLASDNPDPRDLDEVRYLAQEAGNALHGNAIGVQCSSAPPLKFTKMPDRAQLATTYENLLSRTVKDAQKLYESRAPAQAAKKKLDDAKAHLAEVKGAKPASTATAPKPTVSTKIGSDSDAIAKAAAEQRAYQEKERQRINEVYRQQQKQQKEQLDAMALLREAQRQYNSVNSQKYTAERDLGAVDQQNKAMLNGDLSPGPR